MNCHEKKVYTNKQSANATADVHNRDLYRQEGEMNAYHCKFHKGWHLGHPKSYDKNSGGRIFNILDKLKK